MGCRKIRVEEYYDDLTGEVHLLEALEEMVFVFDGVALAVHLNDENAAAFRAAMAPFVEAARQTSKAKVMSTLPKKPRHLRAVPDVTEPVEAPPETPFPGKGEESQPLSEPEVPEVPGQAPDVSDFSSPNAPSRPSLSVVPTPRTSIPPEWAKYAPSARDDQPTRIFKCRQWATAMGTPAHETLNGVVFETWETFYREQRWVNHV